MYLGSCIHTYIQNMYVSMYIFIYLDITLFHNQIITHS